MKKSLRIIATVMLLSFSHQNNASEKKYFDPIRKSRQGFGYIGRVNYVPHRSLINQNSPQIKALNATMAQFNQTIKNDPDVKRYYEDPQNCLQYIKGLSVTYNCQHDYIAKNLALTEAQKRSAFEQIDFTKDETDYGLGNRLYEPDFYVGFCMDWCYANLAEYVLVDSGKPNFFTELMKNPHFNMYENFAYQTAPCMLAMYLVTNLTVLEKIITRPDFNPNYQNYEGNTPILLTMVDQVFPDLVDTICATIKILVKKGADPRLSNNKGITPLIRAEQTGFPKLIETIKESLKKNP